VLHSAVVFHEVRSGDEKQEQPDHPHWEVSKQPAQQRCKLTWGNSGVKDVLLEKEPHQCLRRKSERHGKLFLGIPKEYLQNIGTMLGKSSVERCPTSRAAPAAHPGSRGASFVSPPWAGLPRLGTLTVQRFPGTGMTLEKSLPSQQMAGGCSQSFPVTRPSSRGGWSSGRQGTGATNGKDKTSGENGGRSQKNCSIPAVLKSGEAQGNHHEVPHSSGHLNI
ncbi:hypothetical protein DV515_00003505, partial [Chloebia gouldiae]